MIQCSTLCIIVLICSALIKLVQNSTNEKTRSAAVEVAISLFYHLSSLVSEDTRYYPPTRQFFSACIEMLGQVCCALILRHFLETGNSI